MPTPRRRLAALALAAMMLAAAPLAAAAAAAQAGAAAAGRTTTTTSTTTATTTSNAADAPATCRRVRFATFNLSLNRDQAGRLLADLTAAGGSEQARNASHILQLLRPDVVLLNEFDYDVDGAALRAFLEGYLAVPQAPGLAPLDHFAHFYAGPVNTGVHPEPPRDFDHCGRTDGPADAFGFGKHPGQYGMAVLSRFPIAGVRSFQRFLWRDLPEARLPVDPARGGGGGAPKPWFSPGDLEVFRLSSKSHWDVAIDVPCDGDGDGGDGGGGAGARRRVHLLAHHPTPPVFDGAEHRNRLRNFDEIRLMAEYAGCGAGGGPASWAFLVDDAGQRGGLPESGGEGEGEGEGDARQPAFVIAGDHNADPLDGASEPGAIQQLLGCARVDASFVPMSEGGRERGNRRAGDRTPPETKTTDFDLRCDYVLPSRSLGAVVGGGVFWPVRADPKSGLLACSDHRPVWLDVDVAAAAAPSVAPSAPAASTVVVV